MASGSPTHKTCYVGDPYVYLLRLGFIRYEKMCEHSNTNSAAALREARRRKILENSANRLKLIEGINSSHAKASCDTFQEPKPEPEVRKTINLNKEIPSSEINSKLSDLLKTNKELREISDFLMKQNDNLDEEVVEEEKEVEVATEELKSGNVFLNLVVQKRLHYVLLALAVNFLFLLNAGYLFYDNIFCPFYSLKAIELISNRGQRAYQPVLHLIVAGLPMRVQKVTKITLTLLQALFSDLCIYLFTFIIGAKIVNNEH